MRTTHRVARGAWRVARGAWRVARGVWHGTVGHVVPSTSLTEDMPASSLAQIRAALCSLEEWAQELSAKEQLLANRTACFRVGGGLNHPEQSGQAAANRLRLRALRPDARKPCGPNAPRFPAAATSLRWQHCPDPAEAGSVGVRGASASRRNVCGVLRTKSCRLPFWQRAKNICSILEFGTHGLASCDLAPGTTLDRMSM